MTKNRRFFADYGDKLKIFADYGDKLKIGWRGIFLYGGGIFYEAEPAFAGTGPVFTGMGARFRGHKETALLSKAPRIIEIMCMHNRMN